MATFLSISGAFGLQAAPIAKRFAFWFVLLALGTLVSRAMRQALTRHEVFTDRPVFSAVAPTAVLAIPLTLVVMIARISVFGHASFGWGIWLYVFGAVIVVSASVATLQSMAKPPRFTHWQADSGSTAHVAPRFLTRLPLKLHGADLYAVQAQDHYLRLHTSRGSDLILMRLSDAIAELDGIEGARTHRSWWVGRDAVLSVERANDRIGLRLAGDLYVPVSRNYAPALRAAGWL